MAVPQEYLERLEDWDESSKRKSNPRHYLKKRKEYSIIKTIIPHDRIGISPAALLHELKLNHVSIDRKNLRIHLTGLIQKGFIVKGPGKHGRYYPTALAMDNARLSAAALSESLRNIVEGLDVIFDNYDATVAHGNYFSIDRRSDFLTMNIFEFANKIGAIILLTLIYTFDKDIEKLIQSWLLPVMESPFPLWVEKRNRRHGWIEEVLVRIIMPMMEQLVELFRSPSSYEKVTNSFSTIYPKIFNDMETIKKDLYKKIDAIKNEEKHWASARKYQAICKHDFGLPADTFYKRDRTRFKHCNKCHLTVYPHGVKPPRAYSAL